MLVVCLFASKLRESVEELGQGRMRGVADGTRKLDRMRFRSGEGKGSGGCVLLLLRVDWFVVARERQVFLSPSFNVKIAFDTAAVGKRGTRIKGDDGDDGEKCWPGCRGEGRHARRIGWSVGRKRKRRRESGRG